MNRRQFIRYAAGVSMFAGAAGILQACAKEGKAEITAAPEFSGRIGIIGAGAAGLYIADMLTRRGYDVFILEASGRIGGRVKRMTNFADFDVELGAERVRGQISILDVLVNLAGFQFVQTALNDYCFYDGSLKKLSQINQQPDYVNAMEFINSIPSYSGSEIPLSQYASQQGTAASMTNLLSARLGNFLGTSNSSLSMLSLAAQLRKWSAGSDILRLRTGTFYEVLMNRFGYLENKVLLNAPVNAINYSGGTIEITDSFNNKYTCDRLAVTVPLAILKSGQIRFTPDLPVNKKQAIDLIGMGGGLKIILKFNTGFWENKTGSVIGGGMIPEYLAAGAGGRSAENNVLTAMINGETGDYLSGLGDRAIDLVITDLQNIFGDSSIRNSLAAYYIQDWKREPYINGTFSFASPGSDLKRADLAASVNRKIFFAGEAAHTGGHFGTLHGALETAETLVKEIIQL